MKIKAIIFGASGMVGRGVLLECLESDEVESVLMVNRSSIGVKHEKLKEVIHTDFKDYSSIQDDLKGYNACFWPLGISVVGLTEEKYTEITHTYALTAGKLLSELNSEMTFCYVSGTGTDSTEKGRTMWARVKGRTENDLLALPFKAAYMFRPGYIQPMKGIRSKTKLYQTMYDLFRWIYPIIKSLAPNSVTNTTQVGKAMIYCAKAHPDVRILHAKEINAMAEKL